MKQIYAIVAFTFFSFSLFAQLPVSEIASNKKVVLEEFTGITCVFCPDGHKIASDLKDANPGNFFPINIHTGGFANPQGPGTDFRTADGNTIANQPGMGIEGYPQGAMNRINFVDDSPGMAHSRGAWAANTATVLSQMSYVNVAGEATLDVTTRELTIDIEAFYTMEGAPETNKYSVYLLQDNISGPQTGGSDFFPEALNDDGTYNHNHMLRDVLNATTLGDEIAETTMGSKFSTQLKYTIPADYTDVSAELADMHLLVSVSETNTNIMTAAAIPIEYIGFTTVNNAGVENVKDIAATCKNTVSPEFKLRNQGSSDLTSADISYSVNGGTPEIFNWTGTITPLGSEVVALPELMYTLESNNTLVIEVTNVNGGDDEDQSNNSASVEFEEATAVGNTVELFFDIRTDQYGAETTWNMYDGAGDVIASGGPYNNLGGAGTTLHEEQITVPSDGCYAVELLDSYGDGINAGYGNGNAELRDAYDNVIWSTNGVFTGEIGEEYTIFQTVAIEELKQEGFSIFPNPASDNLNIKFDAQNGSYNIQILDVTGRAVFNQNLGKVNGQQNINLQVDQFSAGIYIVDIVKEGKKYTQRIVIQ